MMLSGKDSFWLQLEVCREYQRSRCTRSDGDCKFAHPPKNVDVGPNGRVTACYDSIKGRCQREQCKYMHPPAHLKDQLLINGRNHLALKNAIIQQHQDVLVGGVGANCLLSPGQPLVKPPASYMPSNSSNSNSTNSSISISNNSSNCSSSSSSSSSTTNTASATNTPIQSPASSALFQSALALAAARHQQQFAAANAAAAAAIAASNSVSHNFGRHHHNQHHKPTTTLAQATQDHQQQHHHHLQALQHHQQHHIKAFDLSLAQTNPAAALAAAFAASSMNPFSAMAAAAAAANPFAVPPQAAAYANQYAAALAAVTSQQLQQRHHFTQPAAAALIPPTAPSLSMATRPATINGPQHKQQGGVDTPSTTTTLPGKRRECDSEHCEEGDEGEGEDEDEGEEKNRKRQRVEADGTGTNTQACDRVSSEQRAESTTSSGCDVNSPASGSSPSQLNGAQVAINNTTNNNNQQAEKRANSLRVETTESQLNKQTDEASEEDCEREINTKNGSCTPKAAIYNVN